MIRFVESMKQEIFLQGFALPCSRNSFLLRFCFTLLRGSLCSKTLYTLPYLRNIFRLGFCFIFIKRYVFFYYWYWSSERWSIQMNIIIQPDHLIFIFTLIISHMIICWSILMINWSDDHHLPPWSSDLYFHLDHLREDLGKAEKIFSHWQPTVLPGENCWDLIEITFLGTPTAS